jgi:hypothetical protein
MFYFTVSVEAAPGPKMILAGDSWARLMCWNETFEEALWKRKLRRVKVDHCNDTTKFGGRALNWLTYKAARETEKRLPAAQVVYLSLGGNDFLYSWNKSMSNEEESRLIDTIVVALDEIISQMLRLNPKVKILLSGYDYGNFVAFTKFRSYVELFKHMGEPTPLELNTAFLRFSERVSQLADHQSVFYIQHYGLMHYYEGNKKMGLRPKITLPPHMISTRENPNAYGGDPRFAISQSSVMSIWPFYYDAFHLSPKGYVYVAFHAIDIYMKEWLRDKP